jgi:hypothetical protein
MGDSSQFISNSSNAASISSSVDMKNPRVQVHRGQGTIRAKSRSGLKSWTRM